MDHIDYVLGMLKINSLSKPGAQSTFADSILEFWGLGPEHRFSVHAHVFKTEMNVGDYLRRVLPEPLPFPGDGGVGK